MTDQSPWDFVLRINAELYNEGKLPMWTIYDHPADEPECFVARCFAVDKVPTSTEAMIRSPELEALRSVFKKCGLVCFTRNEGDEPKIVETWT